MDGKDSKIKEFKDSKFKDSKFKDSRVQGFKVQRFKYSRVQIFKGSSLKGVLEKRMAIVSQTSESPLNLISFGYPIFFGHAIGIAIGSPKFLGNQMKVPLVA